jgi:hypothetical protein
MTDYEYIYQQAKKAHYKRWDDEELRACQEVLPNLTREELVKLYRSKWVDDKLRKSVFNVLFADKVGKREERIKTENTEKLILEFQDKKGGNVALARKELRERYKAGKDKMMIAQVFNQSTKSDQQWVKWQVRKERYGNSGNNSNQWKKTSWQ